MFTHTRRSSATSSCSALVNLSACSSSLPFCCPSSTTCIPLTASLSSVICCPTGSDCSYIEPVTCDVSLQNATAYPYNTLHTTQLDTTLPACGAQCCPLGYECVSGICAREITSASASTATSSPTSTGTGVIVPTNTAISIILANATTLISSSSQSTGLYPPRAILIGVTAGLATGVFLTLALIYIFRRHRRNTQLQRRQSVSIFGGKTPSPVSEPFFTPQHSVTNRTDFLLRLDSPQSSPAPLLGPRSEASPQTPMSQMTARRSSGLPPIFQSPLRFGLPVSPLPPPRRPTYVDDQAMRLMTKSEQARGRPAVPRPTVERVTSDRASFTRQNSDDSYISAGSNGSGRSHKTSASSATINVLMPPPLMAERQPEKTRGVSTHTTMTSLMGGAGLRLGDHPAFRGK